jgi:hypothetical protein
MIAFRELRHAVFGEDLVREHPMLLGDGREQHLLELHRIDLALPLVFARNDDVDAVRPIAHVLVDPVELDLELIGREADRAEDTEAPGPTNRSDDVAAVGERKNRQLDPEPLAELRMHRSCLDQTLVCGQRGARAGCARSPGAPRSLPR